METSAEAEIGSDLSLREEPPIYGKIALRPYQQDACDETWHLFFEQGFDRLLGEMSTGGGKTICFSHLAERMAKEQRSKTLILADQDELIEQAVTKLYQTTGIYADIEKASQRASLNAQVVVSTIQSMRGRLAKYPPDYFGLVVADECDKSVADQWAKVLTHFAGAKILGVT